MTNLVQPIAIAVSAFLLLAVLELVRRRKLSEEYSLVWIAVALGLVALSVRRDVLDAAARRLGVYYPPALLLLGLIVFVFASALYFSVVMSRQRRQIERLVEELAIIDARQRRLEAASGRPVPAAEVIPGAGGQRGDARHERHVGRERHVSEVEREN
jgi:hypothetical protein